MRYHIIVFLLFYIPIFSQQDPSLWGSDPKKLKGAKIILNSEKSPDNSSNFYIDLPILKRYGSRYFNSKKKGTTLSFKANNSALLGKEYEILNVLKNKEIPEHPVLGSTYVFFINDPDFGDIFIEDIANYNSTFLVLGGVETPSENEIYCSDFYKSYDKFEKSNTTYTFIGPNRNISLLKISNQEKDYESYKLRLESYGLEPLVGKKGVKMIFDDGEILDYPDIDIDINVSVEYSGRYDYSAYVEIDRKLHEKLYNNLLTDYRLYIVDSGADGELLNKKYICLVDETYSLKE